MRLSEFITDPSSNALSMSRLCLGIIVCMDIIWVFSCIKGIPPANLVAPVSSMLGVVTGAICGVYGANSFGGAWHRMMGSFGGSPDMATGRPKPKTRPKE